jgi:hypothetical protein
MSGSVCKSASAARATRHAHTSVKFRTRLSIDRRHGGNPQGGGEGEIIVDDFFRGEM